MSKRSQKSNNGTKVTQCVPWCGEVRAACHRDHLYRDRRAALFWSVIVKSSISGSKRLKRSLAQTIAGPVLQARLYVEARVEHHACNDHEQQSRTCAAYTQPRLDPVHFHDQFFLLFGHVGLSAVQEELVIFMHGKGAAVDEEND
ncbi:MAG TPA: hypothetical protein VGJ51_08125 [Candidatus Angelobacter sp.]|jgi:hypothetical protein